MLSKVASAAATQAVRRSASTMTITATAARAGTLVRVAAAAVPTGSHAGAAAAFSSTLANVPVPSAAATSGTGGAGADLGTAGAALFSSASPIKVERVAGALGAELSGVDLSKITDEEFEVVREALREHLVLFFRDQGKLDNKTHVELAKRFGPPERHAIVKGLEDCPDVVRIVREAGEQTKFGETWHTDLSFMDRPTSISLLRAIEVPPYGNDTMWSNCYAAYEGLSEGMREALDGLTAIHGAGRAFSPDDPEREAKFDAADDDDRVAMKYQKNEWLTREVEHPLVRTHPETGRKALYVNSMFTYRITGWTDAESAPLLRFLVEHCARPEYTVRFRWTPNAVAIWDNRPTQHVAMNDFSQLRRVMQRVTVAGERPF